MLFDKYPYTDFHELNLDWIIKMIKALDKEISDFTAFNKITFCGDWDGSIPYVAWSVVTDGAGNGYMAIKAVPVNVALSNTEYWVEVSDYASLYSAYELRLQAVESAVTTLTANQANFVPKTREINGQPLSSDFDIDASEVPYDNTVSGLSASRVQSAIDELAGRLNLKSETHTFSFATDLAVTDKGVRVAQLNYTPGHTPLFVSIMSVAESSKYIPVVFTYGGDVYLNYYSAIASGTITVANSNVVVRVFYAG